MCGCVTGWSLAGATCRSSRADAGDKLRAGTTDGADVRDAAATCCGQPAGGRADDPDAIREVGVQIATELSQRLLAEGAPGLHFYTMNRSLATLQVYANLAGRHV